jgi:hypothetical protein
MIVAWLASGGRITMGTSELGWVCGAVLGVMACSSSATPADAGVGEGDAALGQGVWQRLPRASAAAWPEARGYADLVPDPSSGSLLLVGGEAGPSPDLTSGLPGNGGVWSLDAVAGQWSLLAASNPIVADGVVSDPEAGRLIGHVSFRTNGTATPELISETWAFHPGAKTWENRRPAQSPPRGLVLAGAQMAFDSRAKRVMLFGGWDLVNNSFSNETWVYDHAANTWTNLRPTTSPPSRNSSALVYDEAADRTILFGGATALGGALNDTWAYDARTNAWTNLKPTSAPSAREYARLVYLPAQGRSALYGGVDYPDETNVSAETWFYEYASNTWTRFTPDGNPGRCGWYAMAYSSAAEAVVLFGGGVDRVHFTADAWLYRLPELVTRR